MWNEDMWILSIVSGSLIWLLAKAIYHDWQHDRYQGMQNLAYRLYVRTGKKTAAFDTLSRRHAKAAERERSAWVKIREKEETVFRAECRCPQCNFEAVHWLVNGYRRKCRECGHEWRQK